MNKINYDSLVADLIQELLDYGMNENDLIWMLTQYGYTDKQIKTNFGIPFDVNDFSSGK